MSVRSTFDSILSAHQTLCGEVMDQAVTEAQREGYTLALKDSVDAIQDWWDKRSIKGSTREDFQEILVEVAKVVNEAVEAYKASHPTPTPAADVHHFTGAQFAAAILKAKREAVEEYKESHLTPTPTSEFTGPRMAAAVEVCNTWERLGRSCVASPLPIYWQELSQAIGKLNTALGRPDPTPAFSIPTVAEELDELRSIRDAAEGVCQAWEKQVAGVPRDYFIGMGDSLQPMLALFAALRRPLPIQLRLL